MKSRDLDSDTKRVWANRDFEARILVARRRIFPLALRILGNRSDAEDVTQEVLVRAWASYAGYDPARSFEGWICRITVNLCIDHLRRRRQRQALSLDSLWGADPEQEMVSVEPADSSNDPAERLMAETLDERLETVLMGLPVHYRQCVLLLERDHTYEEIADRLHCPLGTIRSRVNRARTKARAALSTYGSMSS